MKTTTEEFRQCIDELRQEFEQTPKIAYMISNFIGHIAENYSMKFHFILEFIQNAVDSVPKDQKVKVRFCLRKEHDQTILTVSNNGHPFSFTDIERLCGITKERKGPDKIGYKGIGFKSVAHITDNPRIYSRNCRFEFAKQYHPTPENFWLVVPHWIESPDLPDDIDAPADWVTFVLPLRDDVALDELSAELDRLADEKASPALLLFLENLEELEIIDKLNDEHLRLYKQAEDQAGGVNSIKAIKDGQERTLGTWLVTHYPLSRSAKAIPPEALSEYEDKRGIAKRVVNGKNTTISLAFRIVKEGEIWRFVEKEGPICAFFPIGVGHNDSGLRFTVQADFLTNMNREALLPHSHWNRWLIANIPAAINDAIELFKQQPAWHALIYDVLPLENEGKGIFSEVTTELLKTVRNTDMILTDDNTWATPSQTFWLDDNALHGLLNNDDLFLLGLEKKKKAFASSQILNDSTNFQRLNSVLCSKKGLNVEKFDQKMLFDALCYEPWLQSKQNTPEWFERLFAYLSKKELKEAEIARIRGLSLIPTTDGALARPREVFLPTEPPLALTGARFVHAQFAANQEIVNFLLHRLNIRPGHAENILRVLLLPIFQATVKGRLSAEDDRLLAEYLDFVKKHYDAGALTSDQTFAQQLRTSLKLKADNQAWYPLTELYLPSNTSDVGKERSGQMPVELVGKADQATWKAFYQWLGLTEKSEKTRFLESLTESLLQSKREEMAWFETLFGDLLKYELTETELAKLRDLPLIPANDGNLRRPKEVFLPTPTLISLTNARFVHDRFMANPDIVRFLQERLSIRRGTAETLLTDVVIPKFRNTPKGRVADADHRIFTEYVEFVKNYSEQMTAQIDQPLFQQLRHHVKLNAADQAWYPLSDLCIPGNAQHLAKDRTGKIPVRLFQNADQASWKAFYKWLGLPAQILPEPTQHKGARGEKLAFDYLKQTLRRRYAGRQITEASKGKLMIEAENGGVIEAHWLNSACLQGEKHQESGASYDIQITEDGTTHYYEVKTTEQQNVNDAFDLSDGEWQLAQKQGAQYHILRVYLPQAESENVKVVAIDDPSRLLKQGSMSLKISHTEPSKVEFSATRSAETQVTFDTFRASPSDVSHQP